MAFLALLTRVGERGITRDKITGLFWPDAEDDRARRSLANAISALRRDLADDLLLPGNQLRLNSDVVTSDVQEFETAVRVGDLARAATLYEGPFLDGFHLAGAPEFDRWMDSERAALAHSYGTVVEKLARAAESRGDPADAVAWYRKAASHDPLNARLSVGLMRSLVATGDRAAAVRHAQIYEVLVDQELGIAPDREVVAFAAQLRDDAQRSSTTTPNAQPAPLTLVDTEPDVVLQSARVAGAAPELGPTSPTAASPLARSRTWKAPAGVAALALLVAAIAFAVNKAGDHGAPSGDLPVIALGQIVDHRTNRSLEVVKPLTDMLATSLARSPAVRVVSTGRMYELASRSAPLGVDATPDAYTRAARAAGASEVVEGALYAVDDTTWRLDLRRVDLQTGNVRAARPAFAREPFALADSGTVRLLADLGAEAPRGSVADITTRSLAAYGFYEEGLRAFYLEDLASAERLFRAALAEDSTFASATYYLAMSLRQDDAANTYQLLERAVRLAANTSDRERLTIRAHWEERTSSPGLRATAESLLIRYPDEAESHLFTGIVRVSDGEFLAAVPYFERAVAIDSLSLYGERARCTACEAFMWLSVAYDLADSSARSERAVRRWLAIQPRSGRAYGSLIEALTRNGKIDEATAAWRDRSRLAPGFEVGEDVIARIDIRGLRFDEADALMRAVVATGSPARQMQAYWYLGISARYQGRIREALRYAREEQRVRRVAMPTAAPPSAGLSEGQALQELGRGREAAAVFEQFARWQPGTMPAPDVAPGMFSRRRAWNLTHAASALASVGDTARLAALADTIEGYGEHTLSRLHRDLHHHVRGLLLAARGQDDAAIAEFRKAMYSAASGYTRTSYELGKLLLRTGRADEAVAVVGPARCGGVEATS
jgi:DNA-binding SARP family transcriptional activator